MRRTIFIMLAASTALAACATTDRGATRAEIAAHDKLVAGCFDSIERFSPYTTKFPDVDGIPGGIAVPLEEAMSIRAHAPYRPQMPLSEAEFHAYLVEQAQFGRFAESAIRYERFGDANYALTIAVLPNGRRHAQVVRNSQPCGITEVSSR